MSDEGFLKRWSRKKREPGPESQSAPAQPPPSNLPPQAGEGSASSLSPAQRGKVGIGATPPQPGPNATPDEEAIDPATLPPVESLGPDSDYTVFLKKGVPEALKLAALRKAWTSDPFIRDFRSPAIDYGWDFTTPDYSLRAGDDVSKMVDEILPPAAGKGEKHADPAPSAPQAPPPEAAAGVKAAPADVKSPEKTAAADGVPPSPLSAQSDPPSSRRKHGGALPK
jgi:hypothetical protein